MTYFPTKVKSKGFSFIFKKSAAAAPVTSSADASTPAKANNTVQRLRLSHPTFLDSQITSKQILSEIPDESVQRPAGVQPSVRLDYPRCVGSPHVGVVPCNNYDASESYFPNPDKYYEYALACPCGGEMILRCEVNGSGEVNRHSISHHNHNNITKEKLRVEGKAESCHNGSKTNFGDSGFGRNNESLEEITMLDKHIKATLPKTVSHITETDLPVDDIPGRISMKRSAETAMSGSYDKDPLKSRSLPTEVDESGLPEAVFKSGQDVSYEVSFSHEIYKDNSLTDSLHAKEPPLDHILTFEKWIYNADWKFGIYIDSTISDGLRKMEIFSLREGLLFIHVREELIIPNVTTCSDLVAFKPDGLQENTFIARPVRYYNTILSGRTMIRFGRDIKTDAIALSACPSQSLDDIASRGGNVQFWSDVTGLIDVPAIDIRKLAAGSIFLPLHLFRIRACFPLVKNSGLSSIGNWKLLRMEPVLETDSKIGDLRVPDYYWPTGAQRWDDVFVKYENKNDFVLYSRTHPDHVITAPRSHCRIADEHKGNRLTAVVVPRPKCLTNQWIALLAAPIQIAMQETDDRLFNFAPKTYEYMPLPFPTQVIDKVMALNDSLQSAHVSKDHPVSLDRGIELIRSQGGKTPNLGTPRRKT